jgi:hypothetical protein
MVSKEFHRKAMIFLFFTHYTSDGVFCGLLDIWMGVLQGRSHRYQPSQTLQNICVMSHERIEPNTNKGQVNCMS